MNDKMKALFDDIDRVNKVMSHFNEKLDSLHTSIFKEFIKDIRESSDSVFNYERIVTPESVLSDIELVDVVIKYITKAKDVYLGYISDFSIGEKFGYYDRLEEYCDDVLEVLEETKYTYENEYYLVTGQKFYFIPVKFYDWLSLNDGARALRYNYYSYNSNVLLGTVYTNIIDAFKRVTQKGAVFVFNSNFEFCEVICNEYDISEGFTYISKYLTSVQIQDIQNSNAYKQLLMTSKLSNDENFTTYIKPAFADIKYSKSEVSNYSVASVNDSHTNKYTIELFNDINDVKSKYNFATCKIGDRIKKDNPNWKIR